MKKKVAIITVLVAFGILSIAPFALAEEINPTPGTYSYGSTSEFSPYAELTGGPGPTPPGPEPTPGLAPTGQNAWLLYIVAILAIVTPLTYFGIKKLRKQ